MRIETWILQRGRHNPHAHGTRHVQAIPMSAMELWQVNSDFLDIPLHPCLATPSNIASCSTLFATHTRICTVKDIDNSLLGFWGGTFDSATPQEYMYMVINIISSSFLRTNDWNPPILNAKATQVIQMFVPWQIKDHGQSHGKCRKRWVVQSVGIQKAK